eukprot:GHVP01023486.1.p1 GENE.GHVP01023486.1~~GHVP01023486.1.p1  ORF type:complete len:219 (+),score=33.93 GHVP01023486.1:42-698(+)
MSVLKTDLSLRQASLSSNADQGATNYPFILYVFAVEDKGMYFTVIATLFHIITEGRRIFWVSCPDCRKKVKAIGESNFSGGVQQDDDIQYFCETCNKSVSTPVKKYVLSIEIQDESDELTCTIMAENAEALICLPVDNLLAYKTELSPDGKDLDDFLQDKQQRIYKMRIKAKSELHNDERRIRYNLYNCEPLENSANGFAKIGLELATEVRGILLDSK